jgi:hypothetical protein
MAEAAVGIAARQRPMRRALDGYPAICAFRPELSKSEDGVEGRMTIT